MFLFFQMIGTTKAYNGHPGELDNSTKGERERENERMGHLHNNNWTNMLDAVQSLTIYPLCKLAPTKEKARVHGDLLIV